MEKHLNGKAQFDLEQGHTAENPKLRRVANPTDISEHIVMSYSKVLQSKQWQI